MSGGLKGCTPRMADRLAHPDDQGPSRAGSLCPQGLKALYPPDGGVGAVELLPSDLAHLDDQEFLNDTVIDFYMKRAPLPAPAAGVMGQKCRLLVRRQGGYMSRAGFQAPAPPEGLASAGQRCPCREAALLLGQMSGAVGDKCGPPGSLLVATVWSASPAQTLLGVRPVCRQLCGACSLEFDPLG